MNTIVVCSDVRPVPENNKECVVVAYQDLRHGLRETDIPSIVTEIRDRLRAQGIVLGGPLPAAPRTGTQSSLASPIQIFAHDEHGKEYRWIADTMEKYILSSGSTLFYLHIPEAPRDCRWLVGPAL